jgi:NADPH-dependent 2,4-dienoyl-CoA reductase/sulfur reductase-like enzyme
VAQSVRAMDGIFPKSAKWVHKSAKTIDPDHNTVTLCDGSKLEYDYLVVAAGLENDWTKMPGLQEAIEDENSGVVSIYDYDYAKQTWETIQKFKGGRAIFTMLTTPVLFSRPTPVCLTNTIYDFR